MITAFILGLTGSLHCVGMCGPLLLMTPVAGNTPAAIAASRLIYQGGRIATYAVIGIIFGLIGESLIFAGFQRWLSIIVGMLMIAVLLIAIPLKAKLTRIPVSVKTLFARFLRKRTYSSIFALGATNGLLPCGLVYMAATASIATGDATKAALYMVVFGLGTLPMLLTIAAAGSRFNLARMPALQKLTPIAILSVALLLIIRADPVSLLRGNHRPALCPACSQ